jgi:hypothetical protein
MTQAVVVHSAPAFAKWRWLCLTLVWIASAYLVFVPVFAVVTTLFPSVLNALPADISVHMTRDMLWNAATPLPYRFAILLCVAVPAGFSMWAAWSLRQLLLGYARGEVFTADALRYLNHIPLALLLGEIADFFMMAPESLLGSWVNGPGHRAISLGLGTNDIRSLFLAGIAFVIARIMAEAQRIAADHAEIV